MYVPSALQAGERDFENWCGRYILGDDSSWRDLFLASYPCFRDRPLLLFHTHRCSLSSWRGGDAVLWKQDRVLGKVKRRTLNLFDFTSGHGFEQTESSGSPTPNPITGKPRRTFQI